MEKEKNDDDGARDVHGAGARHNSRGKKRKSSRSAVFGADFLWDGRFWSGHFFGSRAVCVALVHVLAIATGIVSS